MGGLVAVADLQQHSQKRAIEANERDFDGTGVTGARRRRIWNGRASMKLQGDDVGPISCRR
jgi:hypothetical protein